MCLGWSVTVSLKDLQMRPDGHGGDVSDDQRTDHQVSETPQYAVDE